MASERYFVDQRCGIIAVRDRQDTQPGPGLHPDTPGVVWHRMGMQCSSGRQIWWQLDPQDIEEAKRVCAAANARERQHAEHDG